MDSRMLGVQLQLGPRGLGCLDDDVIAVELPGGTGLAAQPPRLNGLIFGRKGHRDLAQLFLGPDPNGIGLGSRLQLGASDGGGIDMPGAFKCTVSAPASVTSSK